MTEKGVWVQNMARKGRGETGTGKLAANLTYHPADDALIMLD